MSRCSRLVLGLLLVASCKRTELSTSSDREPEPGVASASRDAETDANVRAALDAEGCKISRQDRRVFFIRCGDSGDSAMNLGTFDGVVQSVPTAEERRARTFEFVHHLIVTPAVPDTMPAENLLVVIRDQSYVSGSAERMQTDEEPIKVVSFPFPGNLVVIAAINTVDNTQMVAETHLAQWKVSAATVYAKAVENLDTHPLPSRRIEAADSHVNVYRLTAAEDENEASRLLSPKSRASMEAALGGRAVFGIPDRRQLLAARAADDRSVKALRALTSMYAKGPLRISADLFDVDGQGNVRVVR